MDNKVSANPIDYKIPNSLAAIWSMMLPGLGQLLKGRVMPGIFWAFLVAGGYFAYFWPGLTLHALCILDAGFYKGEEGSYLSLDSWYKRLAFLGLVVLLISYVYFRNIY